MKQPFKFSARTRVGFSDTDAQGVVYYGRYNPYFDLARVEYHRMLGLLNRDRGDGDFVMRANDVEYFAPARFDDELEIFVRVSRIGRTSITFEFGAYKIPDGTIPTIANRLKMAKTSNVVAIVEADGKLYSATKEVKVTVGGCGG